jgi:hypothetical protein
MTKPTYRHTAEGVLGVLRESREEKAQGAIGKRASPIATPSHHPRPAAAAQLPAQVRAAQAACPDTPNAPSPCTLLASLVAENRITKGGFGPPRPDPRTTMPHDFNQGLFFMLGFLLAFYFLLPFLGVQV